jgi:SPP1 gp7 family putative phage head morphogenesis protein
MPADKALKWQLDLARYDAATRRRLLAMLAQMDRELLAQLNAGTLTDWGRARIDTLLAQAKQVVGRYYRQAQQDMFADLKALAPVAAASAVIAEVVPSLPTQAALDALLSDVIIMGTPQRAWWERQALDVAFRFTAAVRQGYIAAETNQQIIRRVRGELDVSRRNAAALVQTSVSSVANTARMATFEANADVVQGVRWMATLDAHTCARCGAMDGSTWKLDGTPINAMRPMQQPPIHFNDRCVMAPITRFSTMGDGKRASDAGPVDRKITFEDFLSRQTEAYKIEVLGKGRAELWKDGKITLADLTSGTGRPLTLDQLRSKYE